MEYIVYFLLVCVNRQVRNREKQNQKTAGQITEQNNKQTNLKRNKQNQITNRKARTERT